MNNFAKIKSELKKLKPYFADVLAKNYNISAFLIENKYNPGFVKKLWYDLFKRTPTSDLLIWHTDLKFLNHQKYYKGQFMDYGIGYHECQYLLDAKQKTIHLITSLYGGKITGREDFNPILYVDLTLSSDEKKVGKNYQSRFLFWDEIDDKYGTIKENTVRKEKFDAGLIVKLIDIINFDVIMEGGDNKIKDIFETLPTRAISEISKISAIIDFYFLSVTHIFTNNFYDAFQFFHVMNRLDTSGYYYHNLLVEAIKYSPVYLPSDEQPTRGPKLKTILNRFEGDNYKGLFKINYFENLQILTILIRFHDLIESFHGQNNLESKINHLGFLTKMTAIMNRIDPGNDITIVPESYFDPVTVKHILQIGKEAGTAILKMFDFFENHLHIKDQNLNPFSKFYVIIAAYFYKNPFPSYNLLKNYFITHYFGIDILSKDSPKMIQSFDLATQRWKKTPFRFGNFLFEKHRKSFSSYAPVVKKYKQLSLFYEIEPDYFINIQDRSVLTEEFSFLN